MPSNLDVDGKICQRYHQSLSQRYSGQLNSSVPRVSDLSLIAVKSANLIFPLPFHF